LLHNLHFYWLPARINTLSQSILSLIIPCIKSPWLKKGIWNEILAYFSNDCGGKSFMIDGSVIRAHACVSGYKEAHQQKQALGRSKDGFSTKTHALVDALGLPIRFILTLGQNSEIRQTPKLIEGIKNAHILEDKHSS
jgi:hypothetical protein